MKYNTIFFDFGDTLNRPDPVKHWVVYDWVPDLIIKLYVFSYRLGIISNTSRYQDACWFRKTLADKGILQFFEMIIFSANYGVHKPSVDIFNKAIDFMGVDPSRCVMVGDNVKCDGASQYLGMTYLPIKPQTNWSQDLLDLLADSMPKTRKLSILKECNVFGDNIVASVRHFSEVINVNDFIVAKGIEYQVLDVQPTFTKNDYMTKDHYIHLKVRAV